jgi:hypothetical protein
VALVPEGRRLFPQSHRGGESARRRPSGAGRELDPVPGLRAVSLSRREAARLPRGAVGRPAADGGHRTGPHGESPPPHVRRGLARPRPARSTRSPRACCWAVSTRSSPWACRSPSA